MFQCLWSEIPKAKISPKVKSEPQNISQLLKLVSGKGCHFSFFMGPGDSRSREASQSKSGKGRYAKPRGWGWGLQGDRNISRVVLGARLGPTRHVLDSGPTATGNRAQTNNFKCRSQSFLRNTLTCHLPLVTCQDLTLLFYVLLTPLSCMLWFLYPWAGKCLSLFLLTFIWKIFEWLRHAYGKPEQAAWTGVHVAAVTTVITIITFIEGKSPSSSCATVTQLCSPRAPSDEFFLVTPCRYVQVLHHICAYVWVCVPGVSTPLVVFCTRCFEPFLTCQDFL